MREILFRGKHTRTGEWVEGLLWRKKYNDNRLFISCFPDKDDNEEIYIIDPKTVGQYTGLTDKNGKKIFEGDVVKWDGTEISQIRYCEGVYRLCNAKGYYGVSLHNHYSYVEVIGNIHDNPELLKGE